VEAIAATAESFARSEPCQSSSHLDRPRDELARGWQRAVSGRIEGVFLDLKRASSRGEVGVFQSVSNSNHVLSTFAEELTSAYWPAWNAMHNALPESDVEEKKMFGRGLRGVRQRRVSRGCFLIVGS
jgi:hypothetical protein